MPSGEQRRTGVEQGAVEWSGLTGGWNGLIGIPTPNLGGYKFAEREIAILVVILTALTIWLFARLEASAWGTAMRAVRDCEVASQSIGLDPTVIRTVAFVISAAVTGVAGGMFAAMSDFISPESFPFFQSILFLLVVMIVSIFVFSIAHFDSITGKLLSRIVLLPLVAGISYEIIRYSAKHPGSLLRLVTFPGLLLQKITTKEPDEAQLAIAIRALEEALTV